MFPVFPDSSSCPDRLTDTIFSPFLNYSDDHTSNIDPDQQFFKNSLNISNYYHPSDLSNKINTQLGNSFSSIHFNSRSFFKNIDQIKILLFSLHFSFDVIAVTETWLKYDSPLVEIPGYTFVSNHRRFKGGGGVALYIRDGLQFEMIYSLTLQFANLFLWK